MSENDKILVHITIQEIEAWKADLVDKRRTRADLLEEIQILDRKIEAATFLLGLDEHQDAAAKAIGMK